MARAPASEGSPHSGPGIRGNSTKSRAAIGSAWASRRALSASVARAADIHEGGDDHPRAHDQIDRHRQALRKQELGDEQKTGQRQEDHRIAMAADLAELEREHEHEQRHAGLLAVDAPEADKDGAEGRGRERESHQPAGQGPTARGGDELPDDDRHREAEHPQRQVQGMGDRDQAQADDETQALGRVRRFQPAGACRGAHASASARRHACRCAGPASGPRRSLFTCSP